MDAKIKSWHNYAFGSYVPLKRLVPDFLTLSSRNGNGAVIRVRVSACSWGGAQTIIQFTLCLPNSTE